MRGTGDTGSTAPRSDRDAPQGTRPAEHDKLDDREGIYKLLMEDPEFVKLRTEDEAAISAVIDCIDDYMGELETYQREFDSRLEAYLREEGDAFRAVNEVVYSKIMALQDREQLIQMYENASGEIPRDLQQTEVGDEELPKTVRGFNGIPESIWDVHHRLSEACKEFEEKDYELEKSFHRMINSSKH